MTGIPLCRASQVRPFSSWLEENGVPAAPLLRHVGFSTHHEEIPHRWVAELPIWQLCEVAVQTHGIRDFGLRVGLGSDVAEVGAFGRAVSAAATLRSSLENFLNELGGHSSSAVFGLRLAGRSVWFWRRGLRGLPCDAVEQYALGLMVQILRLVAGPRWAPDRILLQASDLPGELAAEAFAQSRIVLRAPVTAVRFPAPLLSMPLRSPDPAASGALDDFQSQAAATDLAGSLRQALVPVLADGAPGLQWAADVANTSPRTLRRRLRDAGLSWSGLVEQTRFDTARRLLEGSDLELRHIARQVGYADPANFNRAFRRWTGLAPSHYRLRA